MVDKDVDIISGVLEYLKKAGPTNTFRLASVMGVDRARLLSLLKKLEEIQAIRFEYGNVIFIKFVSEEKPKPKPVEIEKSSSRPKQEIKKESAKSKALQVLQIENTKLQGKLLELKETVTELEKKASSHPKTITRTITKTVIKKVPVVKTVIKRILVHLTPLPKKREKKNKETPKLKKKFKISLLPFMRNIPKLKKLSFRILPRKKGNVNK